MTNTPKKYRAVLKVEALDANRQVINTTVVATGLDSLKRKVIGVVDLMDEGDVEEGGL
jgi:hypothetical protein